ncbi:MAG: hypothetical protein NTY04_03310 [Candidatus Staskawiczbacteria bacterium]|nr:hypothetical protein [Candidatus Staskawiczbacteria bacterium]
MAEKFEQTTFDDALKPKPEEGPACGYCGEAWCAFCNKRRLEILEERKLKEQTGKKSTAKKPRQ